MKSDRGGRSDDVPYMWNLKTIFTDELTNQKFLQEVGIPDLLTCLLRNLYAGQEATVRTGHGTTDWFQLGKEYIEVVYCHPAY